MNILAAFIFFTRLPFFTIKQVPASCFKHVVAYWPLVGWLTGGSMAAILWLSAHYFTMPVAVLMAMIGRLLLTGALHEDGLADFLDGFGSSTTPERTLSIMKDSHIGVYGVIGLLFFFLLTGGLLVSIPLETAIVVVIAGDVWAKFVASQLVNLLPYARNEEDSKAKVIYNRMSVWELLLAFLCGALPLVVLLPICLWVAALLPIGMFAFLFWLIKRRLQGYTGDCCGATVLLCELSFYIGIAALL